MQTLVFDPLAMTSATFDFARALRRNHAVPHGQDVDGKIVPVSMAIQFPLKPGASKKTLRPNASA